MRGVFLMDEKMKEGRAQRGPRGEQREDEPPLSRVWDTEGLSESALDQQHQLLLGTC